MGRDGWHHFVRHRLHLGARLSSAELGSTATVVIVLSRHLFCLLSVGRPSLVCVPPARARLMNALPPVVRLSVSPRVPFGAAQRQVFVPFAGPCALLGLVLWPCTSLGPCTLALYFSRGRGLGGLLRTKQQNTASWSPLFLGRLFSVPTRTKKEPAPNYDPLPMKMGRHVNSSACDLSASH